METVISLRMDCLHWCTDDGIFDARNVCSGAVDRLGLTIIDDHPPDPPICLFLFIIIWKIITSSSLKWKPSENLLRSSHEVKIEDEAKPRPAFSPVLSLHPSIALWSSTQTTKSRESLMISHFVPLPSSPGLHSPTPTTLSSFPGLFFTFCSLPSSSPLISSPKKSPLWSNFFHSHHIFTSQFSKKVTFEPLCVCVGLYFVLLGSQQSFFQDPRSSDALPAEAISYGGFGSVFLVSGK